MEDLHHYVHNNGDIPRGDVLKLYWDRLQEFFEIVFNEVLINEKN